jgi:hypothetical protein
VSRVSEKPTTGVLDDLELYTRIYRQMLPVTPNTPIPYGPPLEDAFPPGPDRIATEIRRRLR